MTMPPPRRRFGFDATRRLRGGRCFDTVFDAGLRWSRGPLTVVLKPNDLGHCRLGLSISRKVASAVGRNRVKRLLREAFRLTQHDHPGGYDIVVVVRKHEPWRLDDYRRVFLDALTWAQRRTPRPPVPRQPPSGGTPPPAR